MTVSPLLMIVASSCLLGGLAAYAVAEDVRQVDIDVNHEKGPLNRAFRFSVGSDRALIHPRPEHQRVDRRPSLATPDRPQRR